MITKAKMFAATRTVFFLALVLYVSTAPLSEWKIVKEADPNELVCVLILIVNSCIA